MSQQGHRTCLLALPTGPEERGCQRVQGTQLTLRPVGSSHTACDHAVGPLVSILHMTPARTRVPKECPAALH